MRPRTGRCPRTEPNCAAFQEGPRLSTWGLGYRKGRDSQLGEQKEDVPRATHSPEGEHSPTTAESSQPALQG